MFMTNTNSIWNNEERTPFILKPAIKHYIWGGERLKDDFAIETDAKVVAEAWECSTHPDGESIVVSGAFAGKLLSEVLTEHPSVLGSHPKSEGRLPILIKLIDAKQDLSVQVHPDDAYAMEHENGSLGKTELWYVLDATEDAKIVYGFKHDIEKETLRESLQNGDVMKHLQSVPARVDDVFYVEAGTVHAIGTGSLIAEIQQASNITYRLYDYEREDAKGQKRPLHIDKALAVANLSASQPPRQPMRVLKYTPGCAMELLYRCQYFETYRMLINTERNRELATYQADSTSFRVLLCTSGCGTIYMEDGGVLPFFKGDSIFVPANSQKLSLHGKAQFLSVKC